MAHAVLFSVSNDVVRKRSVFFNNIDKCSLSQQSENTEAKQISRMLDFLRKGRADTMDKFIHSLRATNQIHVAQEYLGHALEPDTQSRDGE